jgi:hypothetical protein
MAMPMLCFQPLVARRMAANIAKLPELVLEIQAFKEDGASGA